MGEPLAPSALESAGQRDVEALKVRLEQALERVEALEAKLLTEEQSGARTPSLSRSNKQDEQEEEPMNLAPQTPSYSGWGPGAAVPHAQAQFYLHRPFNFEAFRRANSPRLQAERLRVVAPPDHFPMVWPLPRK